MVAPPRRDRQDDDHARYPGLARQGLVIDGGNRFDAYALSRELRQRTVEVYAALNQVILSRVFTCYQMTATLSQLPLDGTPVVILDLLGTFLDEASPLANAAIC